MDSLESTGVVQFPPELVLPGTSMRPGVRSGVAQTPHAESPIPVKPLRRILSPPRARLLDGVP